MTETLVRDSIRDGVWHVFVDGFEIGNLWAQEQEDGSTRYGFAYQDMDSTVTYQWLSQAEYVLVVMYKTDLLSNQFSGARTD